VQKEAGLVREEYDEEEDEEAAPHFNHPELLPLRVWHGLKCFVYVSIFLLVSAVVLGQIMNQHFGEIGPAPKQNPNPSLLSSLLSFVHSEPVFFPSPLS